MAEVKRMSPLTAMFIGMFLVGGMTIAGVSSIVLYGMHIIDARVSDVFGLARGSVEGLPDLLESLPPAVAELLNDHRAPEYVKNLDVDVSLRVDERGLVRPVMTVSNLGDDVVSMLAVRVAAIDADGVPLYEWTEVVATPVAVCDEWRGPLLPHSTRHVRVARRWGTGRRAD